MQGLTNLAALENMLAIDSVKTESEIIYETPIQY
jgi:hypothetical protein